MERSTFVLWLSGFNEACIFLLILLKRSSPSRFNWAPFPFFWKKMEKVLCAPLKVVWKLPHLYHIFNPYFLKWLSHKNSERIHVSFLRSKIDLCARVLMYSACLIPRHLPPLNVVNDILRKDLAHVNIATNRICVLEFEEKNITTSLRRRLTT